jgi:hypothetical protein
MVAKAQQYLSLTVIRKNYARNRIYAGVTLNIAAPRYDDP